MAKRKFIPNQVFVGVPWEKVRPKYDRIIPKLENKYPLHFTIIGRNDRQDAEVLFEAIKARIQSSSFGVFDASGGNANVSLEYGYAEALEVPRAIFLSARKTKSKKAPGSPIISDLTGMRRVQYKTEKTLTTELNKLCKTHDYTRRFERALTKILKGKSKGDKKSGRALALKVVRAIDGKDEIRRAELVQHLQALGYSEKEADQMIKKLHTAGMIKCTVGKSSVAYIA